MEVVSVNDAEQRAATEYLGPDRRRPLDCDAGTFAKQALVGDQKTPGVFEQLRKLHELISAGLVLLRVSAAGIVVIAIATIASLVLR